jgi:hypothetical protein
MRAKRRSSLPYVRARMLRRGRGGRTGGTWLGQRTRVESLDRHLGVRNGTGNLWSA